MRLLTECCVRRGYFEVRGREGLREGEQVMNSSPKENWQRKRNTTQKKKMESVQSKQHSPRSCTGLPPSAVPPLFPFFFSYVDVGFWSNTQLRPKLVVGTNHFLNSYLRHTVPTSQFGTHSTPNLDKSKPALSFFLFLPTHPTRI